MNPTNETVTYRTKDGQQTGSVSGAGEIVDGMITVPVGVVIENHNLEKIENQAPVQVQPQVQTPTQPVIEVPAPLQPPVSPAPAAPVVSIPQATVPVNPANPPQAEQNTNINTETN